MSVGKKAFGIFIVLNVQKRKFDDNFNEHLNFAKRKHILDLSPVVAEEI